MHRKAHCKSFCVSNFFFPIYIDVSDDFIIGQPCYKIEWNTRLARELESNVSYVHHFLVLSLSFRSWTIFFLSLSLSPSLLLLPFLLLLFFLLLLHYFYYDFTFTRSPSISRRKNVFQIGVWSSAIRSVRGSVKNLHFRKEFHRLSYKVDRLSSIEILRLDTWPNFDRKLKIYLWTNGGTLQWYMY